MTCSIYDPVDAELVAEGLFIPHNSAELFLVHGVPHDPASTARVSIDDVYEGKEERRVPFPTSEGTFVGELKGTPIAWPRYYVKLIGEPAPKVFIFSNPKFLITKS
jgi:hypothetical protein